ncbi:MAG: class I SAM-dependent RNA methyltransferase [Gemmatimonadota bacterium]|nr:class I SAM-dependent RNA methyltransferase [Gemmatimonadota bacterium]
MPELFDAFAVVAPGLAPMVADELFALGNRSLEVVDAGVSFAATPRDLARANVWLRTATRVIVRLAKFEATDFATLERKAKTVPWSRVLRKGAVVQTRVTCKKSRLYHSDAVAQRIARGIEFQIAGCRVESKTADEELEVDANTQQPQLIIVRFDHDICTISADSSGALLHRRGWRQAVAKAPLRETLAAALVTASGWDARQPLVDPFCGSGTIGIEAALKARNIAPGMARTFAMDHWPDINAGLMNSIKRDAKAEARPQAELRIMLSDRDAGACAAARANAERAGMLDCIEIETQSLSETELPKIAATGFVVTNPPYGVRVAGAQDLRSLYQRLGDVMREGGKGWHLTLLAAERAMAAQTRLQLHMKLRTTNGGLPVFIEGN